MNKKNIILIAVIVFLLLVIIIGAVVYFFSINTANAEKDQPIKINKDIVMYSFENSFVNNVKDSRKMIKITMSIELANTKIQELIEARKPEILNQINLIIREKTEEQLAGAEGQSRMQKEILESLRKILSTRKVLNVYFDEFVVQ